MQLPEINLDAISDLATREVVRQLLNIIAALRELHGRILRGDAV